MAQGRRRHGLDGLTGLTVADIMARLAELDPDGLVVMRGEAGGYASIADIRVVPLRLHVNSLQGFGCHEVPGPGEPADTIGIVLVDSTQMATARVGIDLTTIRREDEVFS